MDSNITNENIDELITSYIDNGAQDIETRKKLALMIEKDEILAKKYKSELLTKQVLKEKLKPADIPENTYLRISNAISSFAKEYSPPPPQYAGSYIQYLKTFLTSPLHLGRVAIPRYSAALGLIAVVLFAGILLSKQNRLNINPYVAAGSDKNIMVQAVKNFHKIQSGEIKPEMHSANIGEVSGYLKKKLSFEPYVPNLKDFELLGCICNQFEGENLAHIVYSSGNNLIYVYQADMKNVNGKLELPGPVLQQILSDKYYMCDNVDETNCALLLWYVDNVLCASVSNLSKNNLYSKLISTR